MSRLLSICLLAVFVAGCQQGADTTPQDMIAQVEPSVAGDEAPSAQFGFMEAMYQGPDPFGATTPMARAQAAGAPPTASGPVQEGPAPPPEAAGSQIAYTYGYGFRTAAQDIPDLQEAHTALCASMGTRCQVVRQSRATGDYQDGYGELELKVAADLAVGLEQRLVEPASDLDAELVSSVRTGEDLAEQIIDSEARLEARLLLREKLTAILRNNRGSVDELVKAERAVADVNEEIDATRSKLATFRNRIRFSAVRIEYEPRFGENQLGFARPIGTAIQSIGTTLGITISAIIYVLTALVPVVLLLLAIRWLLHRFGYRVRFWRKDRPA